LSGKLRRHSSVFIIVSIQPQYCYNYSWTYSQNRKETLSTGPAQIFLSERVIDKWNNSV